MDKQSLQNLEQNAIRQLSLQDVQLHLAVVGQMKPEEQMNHINAIRLIRDRQKVLQAQERTRLQSQQKLSISDPHKSKIKSPKLKLNTIEERSNNMKELIISVNLQIAITNQFIQISRQKSARRNEIIAQANQLIANANKKTAIRNQKKAIQRKPLLQKIKSCSLFARLYSLSLTLRFGSRPEKSKSQDFQHSQQEQQCEKLMGNEKSGIATNNLKKQKTK